MNEDPKPCRGARSNARCTCHRDLLCPRCTPVNYSREGAKHRRPVPVDFPRRFTYATTTPPVSTR